MAITSKVYGNAPKQAFSKAIDLINDTIKVMICANTYTPDQDNHIYKDVSVIGEVSGTGYTAGGSTLASKTLTYDGTTNILKFDAADVTLSNAITGRYLVIYDDTPASNKPLLCYVDLGADTSIQTITWDANGIFKVTAS